LQGKPFVFLGVNSDDDREQLRRAIVAKGISWRSWCDGSTKGPIATRWQVELWPTLFVLDAKGVVRYRVSNAVDLEHAVDTLLREVKTAS
jgi:hypothetical protein